MKKFKGFLITGINDIFEPWNMCCLGEIEWDGNDREYLNGYTENHDYNVVGIWYPELSYFLEYRHVYWKGLHFAPNSAEHKMYELVRTYNNAQPVNVDKKLSVNVYKSNLGDCTNNGVTNQSDSLTLHTDLISAKYASYVQPALWYTEESLGRFGTRKCAYPVVNGEVQKGMFGGNFVSASDSRFKEYFSGECSVKVHDRIE